MVVVVVVVAVVCDTAHRMLAVSESRSRVKKVEAVAFFYELE